MADVEDGEQAGWLRQPRYSQSLKLGLAILGLFEPGRLVLGTSDLADALGIGRSTTHRYAITLTALGFLEQTATRKYRLTSRVTDIGIAALSATGLRQLARPLLVELRRATTHTALLGLLDETQVICAAQARSYKQSESLLWMDVRVGRRLQAHQTAMGRLLLAYLPSGQLEKITARLTLPAREQGAVRSRRALAAALAEIRERGFAVAEEEWAPEVIEIAVPVRRESGEVVAALAVVARPANRPVVKLIAEVRPMMESTAASLTAHLEARRTR